MSESAAYRLGRLFGRLPRPVRLAVPMLGIGIVWMLASSGDKSENKSSPVSKTPALQTGATNQHIASIAAQPNNVTEVKPQTPAEKKAQQEKWFGSSTIVAAKRAVKVSLKDPDSAEFKNVYANYTEEYGVVACGYVNAKNSFGGYTGYKAFVSSGKSVIMEGHDQIKKAWHAACK